MSISPEDWSLIRLMTTILGAIGTGFTIAWFAWNFGKSHGEKQTPNSKIPKDLESEVEILTRERDEAKANAARSARDVRRYNALKTALISDQTDLWNAHAASQYDGYETDVLSNDIKVLTVMNLKGGVGKTTLALNLAAHFDLALGQRVLVVDLDYQGSATTALQRMMQTETAPMQHAKHIFAPSDAPPSMAELVTPIHTPLKRSALIPCSYPFAAIENRHMVKWLFQESDQDPRFALARILYSDEFREHFDVVIIDAPPRLTLGAINAITSSRTLLVPTIPDAMSTEAVANFVSQLSTLSSFLNPALANVLIGINRTSGVELKDREKTMIRNAIRASDWAASIKAVPINIPQRVAFAHAITENTLAYLRNDNGAKPITEILSEFGDYVAKEINIRSKERV